MRFRMPFSTDTTWPQSLLTIFNICRQKHEGHENRYYGPYNHLLNYCFRESPDRYFVAPQSPPGDSAPRDSVDFVVLQVVSGVEYGPVLFVEVKNDHRANDARCRYDANTQIRNRFYRMLRNGHSLPQGRLWALSLLGTSLCVYWATVNTKKVEPTSVAYPRASLHLWPEYLEGHWKVDILSRGGFDTVKMVMNDIYNSAVVDTNSQQRGEASQ